MRIALVAMVGCLALSFVGYGTSLRGQFVFDDMEALVWSDCHRGLHRIPQMFDLRSTGVCSVRPIRSLSYALDHALWGLDPFGYHLSNVLLHSVVGLLLWLLVVRIGVSQRIATLTAALYLLHPIGTEVVAYVSGRRDLLAALFSLAAALGFIGLRERRSAWRAAATVICFALALLSHEGVAALPAAVLLVDVALRARAAPGRPLRSALRELLATRRLSLTIGAMLLLVLAFGAWRVFGASHSHRSDLWGPDLGAHIGTVLRVHAHYLKQLAYPTKLIADYSADAFPASRSLADAPALLAGALLCGLLGAALWSWRRAPLGAATALGYFVLLLPVSQIVVYHELLAEHRLYLAAACFCALLGWALDRIVAWRARLGWAAVGAVLLSYAALTNNRNLDWRTEETLWTRTVEQVPRCARALGNLGTQLLERGEVRRARALLERAVAIRPELCAARVNLGEALLRLGEQQARGLRLIEQAGCLARGRHAYRRAVGYAILGRFADAATAYRQAIAAGPPQAANHHGLGRALHALRDTHAITEYQRALALRPGWPAALIDLGRALAETCQQTAARRVLEPLRRGPGRAPALAREAEALLAAMARACPQKPH